MVFSSKVNRLDQPYKVYMNKLKERFCAFLRIVSIINLDCLYILAFIIYIAVEVIKKFDVKIMKVFMKVKKLKYSNFWYQDIRTNFVSLIWYI